MSGGVDGYKQLNATISIVDMVPGLTRRGRYYIGPCPFCGGEDRFNVREGDGGELWLCRHCAPGRYHDVVEFLGLRDQLRPGQVLDRYGTGGAAPTGVGAGVRPAVRVGRPPVIRLMMRGRCLRWRRCRSARRRCGTTRPWGRW